MKLRFVIDKNYDLRFADSAQERKCLAERYRVCWPAFKYTRKEYQKSWDRIDAAFLYSSKKRLFTLGSTGNTDV